MSDTQNNKSDSEIIEAEVISESDATRGAERKEKGTGQYRSTKHAEKPPEGLISRIKHLLLHFAFAIAVILALIFLYSEQSWLSSRFATVDGDLQTLDQKIRQAQVIAADAEKARQEQLQSIETLSKQISQIKASIEENTAVTPDSLAKLRQQLEAQFEQKLSALPKASTDSVDKPAAIEEGRIEALEVKLAALQSEQIALEDKQAQPASMDKKVEPLSLDELKTWAIKINTQWLLQVPQEQIEQQLLAFKQALQVMPVATSNSLSLLLEQDLMQLKEQQVAAQQQKPSVAPLRQLIEQMPVPKTDFQGESGQLPAEQSAWGALLEKFSGLIKIQKRESEQVSHVEALMLHEVIQQRLLMEIDRLDYALQIGSEPMLKRSIERLQTVVAGQAPQIAEEFKAALVPVKSLRGWQRQPLLITQIAAVNQ
ncbi:hypothetical protein [Thiomicrorhabdus xiamenensis]|uniref:Uncharacterized protein n=1 Tax=Thiomicrorhabdus xiamenensis TaxID=2739063 RepID=A0A7D4SR86_9GAMM|nr:hypothetical protein [Thiomicrorhabdus xiamenensis]QKI88183.1 hypothetical protein HQN79_00640 [Thiomicrorhabdus xiamenensis]